jgi:hypothetical protein
MHFMTQQAFWQLFQQLVIVLPIHFSGKDVTLAIEPRFRVSDIS